MKVKTIAAQYSNHNRLKKYRFFWEHFRPTISAKILDVGASEKEYQGNANILEKMYPYQENITVLGIDNYKEFYQRHPLVKVVAYNGGSFPFKDKEFDICWCNAVLEHVGAFAAQEGFLKEICRVAKAAFVTTPNRHFPWEVHTNLFLLHWLPKKIFDDILTKLGKSWARGDYMHLLSLKDIKRLLAKCDIKENNIIRNKIFGFTVDFVILF